jgi:hypothetical protein
VRVNDFGFRKSRQAKALSTLSSVVATVNRQGSLARAMPLLALRTLIQVLYRHLGILSLVLTSMNASSVEHSMFGILSTNL